MSAPKEGSPRTRYVQVHGTENTGKISAFAAFQPGIARVFEVLFEQDDATPEFYLSNAPQFTGVPFADAWRMLPRATLCGVSHADGSVTLAPDDAYVIRADDEVVLVKAGTGGGGGYKPLTRYEREAYCEGNYGNKDCSYQGGSWVINEEAARSWLQQNGY